MVKYTLTLSDDQEQQLDELQKAFKASNRADVFRKVLALGSLVAEAQKDKKSLGIGSENSGKWETIRIL